VGNYSITFAKSARKELESLDAIFVDRILSKIESLAFDPRPKGSRKLKGEENLWRIRVGNYRVVYYVKDKEKIVDIVEVRHRKDVYR